MINMKVGCAFYCSVLFSGNNFVILRITYVVYTYTGFAELTSKKTSDALY